MQNVAGEVEHCLLRNSRDNLEEEGVSPQYLPSIHTLVLFCTHAVKIHNFNAMQTCLRETKYHTFQKILLTSLNLFQISTLARVRHLSLSVMQRFRHRNSKTGRSLGRHNYLGTLYFILSNTATIFLSKKRSLEFEVPLTFVLPLNRLHFCPVHLFL